ncbi:Ras modification protein ERF4 [Sphaceloma murrayae]|uniref:Ras modification protein ERF4 n=1 Tax=Sphaceloma murrayae TaxID=2082308 RepID=A0A2K1QUB1_9PEZI|nr:Ras modification protein ERF4 [Sphaceloma murrayae]
MAATTARVAGIDMPPSTSPAPPPIPTHDPESQTTHSITPRPSRSSLPLDRRPSRKSIASQRSRASLHRGAPDHDVPPLPSAPQYSVTSHSLLPASSTADPLTNLPDPTSSNPPTDADQGQQDDNDNDNDDDIPWGPTHPCFPHPNPHVAPSSEAASSTRVIRVQRDWLLAGDAYPQFQNVYPEILAEWIAEEEFRAVIDEVNGRCKEAFDPEGWRAGVDALIGVLTGFVWEDVGFTGVKSVVKGLEAWFEEWNSTREREGREGRLVQLRTTGWLCLDIVVPDPGIDVVDEET